MLGIITILVSSLFFAQPGTVHGFFTAARAAAQLHWEIGTWQASMPIIQVVDANGGEETISEKIENGTFEELGESWTTQGTVAYEQPSCGAVQDDAIRIGSIPTEPQTMREENSISQTFERGKASSVLIEYCLTSWETAPLFDEPSLQVFINNELVWEDASKISSADINPTHTEWRSALIPLPTTDSIELQINAGNTIDTAGPTVVFVKTVSTAVWNAHADSSLKIVNSSQPITATLNDQLINVVWQDEIATFTSDQIEQFGTSVLKFLFNDGTQRTIYVMLHNPAMQIPPIWYEHGTESEEVTAFFASPPDPLGSKVAQYEVWQRLGDEEQKIEHGSSFLWSSPRMPGDQEYLTFQYQPDAEYRIMFVSRGGYASFSPWQAVDIE